MQNPFTPSFGIVPLYLAGREMILSDLRRALQNGPGDPSLCSIIVGPRGSGKTALLSCIADEAMRQGYIVADTTAVPGMLEDILQRALDASAEIVTRHSSKKVTGISVGQFLGIEWQESAPPKENWRSRMTTLLRELKKTDSGLLITVDEVRANLDEMIQLAAVYQLLIRDGFKCALVMAGLRVHCNQLLDDDSTSFLRRAKQYPLERISDTEIDRAFRKTIESGGKQIQAAALKSAVSASGGYPYMMQLVGFSIWEESGERKTIHEQDAEKGVHAALQDFQNGVLNSTYRELSSGDRTFLRALSDDVSENRVSDIAARMNKTAGYVSSYKLRALEAGVIEETPGKTLMFSIPFFREYLLKHEE